MTTKPVSLTVFQPSAQQTIAAIQFAEQLGIPQVWMPTLPVAPDPLPTLAADEFQTVICPVKDPMGEGRAIMEILGTL